jgi:hypothetical protein
LWEAAAVNELVPDRLDEPWTRSAMAKQADVSPTTLKNWSARESSPLATVPSPIGDAMYTWRHLLNFCKANPNLQATPQVLKQYRVRFPPEPADRPSQLRVGAADATLGEASSASPASPDGVTLRSALEELRTRIGEHFVLVTAAARVADDAASLQQNLLATMAALEAAFATSP